jgi:hypothetical protein
MVIGFRFQTATSTPGLALSLALVSVVEKLQAAGNGCRLGKNLESSRLADCAPLERRWQLGDCEILALMTCVHHFANKGHTTTP